MERSAPTTARQESTEASLRGLARRLHVLWGARLLEPTDARLAHELEDVTGALMIGAQELGLDPHRWCADRYCDCHITFWRHAPTLPLQMA